MRPLPLPEWMCQYYGTIPKIISSIRAHPVGVEPTLESIPQLDLSMMKRQPLSFMIRDMQETGFQEWGFVIYRCAYADNLQWESYLEFFKASVKQQLEAFELSSLLWKYLEWTIIEDPQALDGASKQQIRGEFSHWAIGKTSTEPKIEETPRFKYCVYVDQKCLDSVDQYETWVETGAEGDLKYVICAILDKDCKLSGRGRRGFPSVEGCVRRDTGWMYVTVECVPSVYSRLSYEELADTDYKRPPGVFPLVDPSTFEG
ncbi:hypothetical protein B0J13DRAFT_504247 [Dactylonectria estremocensis]|uniref:Uncharacterized protein n=1 Tax=Dactylonectria estremocensis TaxID=1079267 RepID=A0A9P9EMI9_9HYPO|nr:hypothetical protein B0J13DRAFT_504247 [Dactylonectria estremocensis]